MTIVDERTLASLEPTMANGGRTRANCYMRRFDVLFGAGMLTALGCASAPAPLPASAVRYLQTEDKAVDGPAVPAAAGGPIRVAADEDCDLRLYIEQSPSEGAFGIEEGKLGVAVVERLKVGFIDGVCLQKKDSRLALPSTVLIAGTDSGDLDRFCLNGTKESSAAYGNGLVTLSICKWNRLFHSPKPFTFTLVTGDDHRVDEFVELVRVFRNGDLMAAWNRGSDAANPSKVVIEGNPMRTGFWAASVPPHRAPMDFRIIPRNSGVAGEVDLTIRQDDKLFLKRAAAGLRAGAEQALPAKARASLDCLRKRVVHVAEQVRRTVRGELKKGEDPACALPLSLDYGTPLSQAYSDVRNQTKEKLVELESAAEEKLDEAQKRIEAELPPVVAQALEEGAQALLEAADQTVRQKVAAALAQESVPLVVFLQKRQSVADLDDLYAAFASLAKDVNEQVVYALASVDEARALAHEVLSSARRAAGRTDEQAQIFNAVVAGLREQGDVFEARKDNPALLASEQKLPMEYGDHWQGFFLAPWNGVPIRVGDDTEADLSAAVAIPLLDIAGIRLQWGKTRFAEARLAGGIGYTYTQASDGSSKAAALPNLSLGFGTVKLGLGYVTVDSGSTWVDQLRVIVGADLAKLFTGSNVEAL